MGPAASGAQTARGTVTDAISAPLAGVVILLLDSTESVVRRAITDQAGAFALIAPATGTFRVRAMRIGFRPTTSNPVVFTAGSNLLAPLQLTGVAIALDTVQVASRSLCGWRDSDPGFLAIWEQVRAALAAAQLTAASRGVTATIVSYEGSVDQRTRRMRDQTSRVTTGFVTQPWRSTPIGILRREGYIVTDEEGFVTYHAPGLDALLSDEFVEDHCFRLTRPRTGSRLGIVFDPTRDRRDLAEIKGTIWIDRVTSALLSMEFGYANVSAVQANEAGGTMEFARMADGGWVVSRWSIRMPSLEQEIIDGRPIVRLRDLAVTGGELTLATRGSDTLWMRAMVAFGGSVRDSATGAPVASARVSLRGTPLTAESRIDGGFRLTEVIPGEYTLEVRTAALDSLGAMHEMVVAVLDSAENVAIRIGKPRPRLATFAGVIVGDSAELPIAEVEVAFPDLALNAFTDDGGAFRLTDIPIGEHRVLVRRVGFGALDTTLAFAPARTVNRRIVLERTPTLDTVSVIARSVIPSFDEHRAIGLGAFLTRAELEKQSGRRTSEVLGQVEGVRVIQAAANKAYVATRRRSVASYRATREPGSTESVLQQEEGWCYATVYMNGSVLFRPEPGMPPFDLNTVSVDQIEAIEYYASAAQTPMRYSRGDVSCGVLVIHTRRARP